MKISGIFSTSLAVLLLQIIAQVSNAKAAQPSVCAAIRGNGHYILAHFGSLAQLTEMDPDQGGFNALAGGSSGSITSFIYQSMLLNPLLSICNENADKKCTARQRSEKLALLLKSVVGYGEVLAGGDEIAAMTRLVGVAQKVAQISDVSLMDSTALNKAKLDIQKIFTSSDLAELINPRIFEMLNQPSQLRENLKDIIDSSKNLATFKVNDNSIFFKETILNFDGISKKIGRIGSYYSGYSPVDLTLQARFLDSCAKLTVGLNWSEASQVIPSKSTEEVDQKTCGTLFAESLISYRTALLANESSFHSRISDSISLGIATVLGTSVLDGTSAYNRFEFAKSKYLETRRALSNEEFNISYDDIKFGYWGAETSLSRIQKNLRNYKDAKTEKMVALGDVSWYDVLRFSPAEPGLSTAKVMTPGARVSFGGWSDLHPALVLKNLGCEKVVYITRSGEESRFLQGVVSQLGFSAEQIANLYDINRRDSAFSDSLKESDNVWCTDWNRHKDTEFLNMFNESYQAGQLLNPRDNAIWVPGCTVRN